MISALFKAFGQLPDPRFRAVVLRAVVWSMVLFGLLFGAVWWLIVATKIFQIDWLEWLTDALGWASGVVAGVILFPGAVLTVLTFMLEDIARAVEARYYPHLPPPRAQPFSETLVSALRFAGVVVVLNIILLPLYVAIFFVPLLNVFVFYGLNGYLLGREYFELVAYRRMDHEAVREMRRRHRGQLFVAGVVIAVLLTLPLVNWFMPVVAAAFMLHRFETMRGRAAAA